MSENVGSGVGIDRRLIDLASDPLGLGVLCALGDQLPGASVGEVARTLEVEVKAVLEILTRLEREGIVERIDDPGAREEAELRYRALVLPMWGEDELGELSRDQRRRLTAWIFKMIEADFTEALEFGAYDRSIGAHISRAISMVDEQGWRDLSRIQDEALEAVFAVQGASAERLAERGEKGLTAMTTMICCPLPERPGRVR